MSYDDEELDEERSFKINNDPEDEIFGDDLDEPLEPLEEEGGFKFNEEEEPETI